MGKDIVLEEHSLLRETDLEDVAPIASLDEMQHNNIQSTELDTQTTPRKRAWIGQRIWQLSTIFFALLSLFLYIRPKLSDDEMPKVYPSDFKPAGHSVQYMPVHFTGTPRFADDGRAFLIPDPDQPQYVGDPTLEMDRAWDDLLFGRYFNITAEEAKKAWGDGYKQYYSPAENTYTAGLDVLHTLHCVNVLRKAIYAGYYHGGDSQEFHKYHTDHCIDIVRQAIMCHGDLTPIPLRWWDGLNSSFVDTDQTHTCRDFSKIRHFVTERYNGSSRVW